MKDCKNGQFKCILNEAWYSKHQLPLLSLYHVFFPYRRKPFPTSIILSSKLFPHGDQPDYLWSWNNEGSNMLTCLGTKAHLFLRAIQESVKRITASLLISLSKQHAPSGGY